MEAVIVKRAFMGDPRCGDQGDSWTDGRKTILCIADGLGHGPSAEEAAFAALACASKHKGESLDRIFMSCNEAIRKTRGVAMGLAVVDPEAGTLTYAGIGNTWGIVIGAKNRHLISSYGIVGGGFRKLRPETVPLKPGDLVLLATDGVSERLTGDLSSESRFRELTGLGEEILDRWGRKTDDGAVLLWRYR